MEQDHNKLIKEIEILAVRKRNNLVNVIQFQQMCQESGEWVDAFLACLNRQVVLHCPEHGFSVSFKECLTILQLDCGLQNLSIQESP